MKDIVEFTSAIHTTDMLGRLFKKIDWILTLSALLLSLFGIISMASTTGSLVDSIVISQTIFLLIGLCILTILATVEYRSIQSFAPFGYALVIIMLILVLVIGSERNGSRAWFDLGIMTFQPAELAKLLFIITIARLFTVRPAHEWGTIFIAGLLLLPVGVLILLEPDVGTFLAFIGIWFVMILGSELRGKQIAALCAGAALLVGGLLIAAFTLLPDNNFQLQRMRVYPDHLFMRNLYHTDIGYQVDQSIIAIGSGGIEGKGIGHGSQNQFNFLPAQTTDFIFASIAEEIGLIGAIIVLGLLITIMIRVLQAARASRDLFGRYVCIGIFGMLLYHTAQNIGMNIGLLPVTGIPLSLVSYGGSHLLTVYTGLGLVQSISARARQQV